MKMSEYLEQARDHQYRLAGLRTNRARDKLKEVQDSKLKRMSLKPDIQKLTDAQRKSRFLSLYKLAHGCCVCGYNEDALSLDLDHVNPSDKKYSIGDLRKKSWDILFKEIAKCQVLCAICHRLKTEEERLLAEILD
jgi:hypothetical protein